MRTVGQILKEAREKKGFDLKTVAQMTKIKKETLKALEENDYEQLPSPAYIKGFIKTYARVLEVDPTPLLAIFRRDFKQKSAFPFLLPSEDFSWTPRLTLLSLLLLALIFFAGYLFWQFHLLQTSPY